MRALKILSGIVAAIVVVAALLLIVGIPSGFLTSAIRDRLERETGYRLTVAGSTRIGIWPALNVTMNDVTLEPPKQGGPGHRVTIGSIEAKMTAGGVWSGQSEITELVIHRPVVRIPLLRERQPAATLPAPGPAAASGNAEQNTSRLERITVTDGTVTLFNTHDQVEDHIEGIGVHAVVSPDRQLGISGNARAGGHPLSFDVKASLPPPGRHNIPLELSLDAPGILQAPLSGKAEIRINGAVVMINGLAGTIGDGAFDGWASLDLASKPLVKLDLDFRKLDAAVAPAQAAPQGAAQAAPQGWSDDPIELIGLNYVDAQARLSAAELNIGSAHFAPVALEASLAGGVLKGTLSNLGAYGGQANGAIDIDVSRDTPVYGFRGDLTGVRALPLLRSAAGFDSLDGKLQAKIDVRSTGRSQHAILSNLNGSVLATFQDGAIRGLNLAQMIRALTSGTLTGWQENREQSTDLSQLSASFRIDKGQATTSDLNLVGPLVKMTGAGTVDLGAQTLALRVEPKLVMTTEGQGRAKDPVAFGIPVVIDGPWAAPRIYPEIAGILDNPDAGYAKLKELGKGLFAPGGAGGAPGGNPSAGGQSDPLGGQLGETLGRLIQQGIDASRNRNAPPSGAPNDPSAPAPNDPTPEQRNRQINDLLKQFFGR